MEISYRQVILRHSVEPVKSVTINSNFELVVHFLKDNRIVKGKIDVGLRLWITIMNDLVLISKDYSEPNTHIRESIRYYQFLGFRFLDKAVLKDHFEEFFIEFSLM